MYSAFEMAFFGILAFKSRQAKIGWKSLSQNQLPSSNQELTGQQCAALKPGEKNASCTQKAKQRNKVFIIKGRGSSVVEQPIRNRNLNQRRQRDPNYA